MTVVVSGKTYQKTIGTRAQVWHGTVYKTSGGLTRKDLMQNKAGRIVSKAKHSTAKKEMRLVKYGYGSKKGKFGYVKVGSKTKKSKKSKRGGSPYGDVISPASVSASASGNGLDGQGITNYGNSSTNVQFEAGMAGGSPYGDSINPASAYGIGIDGQGVTNYGKNSTNVQFEAGMAGGSPYGDSINPASAYGIGIDGQGVTNYGKNSTNVQFEAGMAGGKKRRMRKGGAAALGSVSGTMPSAMGSYSGTMPSASGVVPSMIATKLSNAASSIGSGIDGQGITNYRGQDATQMMAANAT
jgi:hypothetical protein